MFAAIIQDHACARDESLRPAARAYRRLLRLQKFPRTLER
jgi:hypothetical protein